MIDKIKNWFTNTVVAWFKKSEAWLHIGSVIATLVWFGQTENPLAAIWFLVLAAYWASKFFGIDIVLFGKKEDAPKASAPTNPMGNTGGGVDFGSDEDDDIGRPSEIVK